MRPPLAVPACVTVLLAIAVAPGVTSAAPRHNHGLTIAATPDPVIAGESVLIYGRLTGAGSGAQPIRLYHHLNGSGRGFTLVGTTTTDPAGYYEFTRADGVVFTNRSWFVRGPDGSHSRIVYELVTPLVSVSASSQSTDTDHPIVFTGTVTPNHAFERVYLQQQIGSTDDWRTLESTFLDGGSQYTIAHRWRRPGVHDVRVLIRRDAWNLAAGSDPVTVDIEQAQVPGFTISSSDPIAPTGSSVTISGVLEQPGTNTGEPDVPVQLWGRTPGQEHLVVLGNATTGQDGSYQFTEAALATNVVYTVRTLRARHMPERRTAPLYQGVQDVVTLQASSTSAMTDQTVSFSGTVMPDKAGHVIYLQKLGQDGDWRTVAVAVVRNDSTYRFGWQFGDAGAFEFRARITSDRLNVGGHSDPVSVTATTPAVSTLPPAS
jgi:hypothetical protein